MLSQRNSTHRLNQCATKRAMELEFPSPCAQTDVKAQEIEKEIVCTDIKKQKRKSKK